MIPTGRRTTGQRRNDGRRKIRLKRNSIDRHTFNFSQKIYPMALFWAVGVFIIELYYFFRSTSLLDDKLESTTLLRRMNRAENSLIKPEDYLTEEQKQRPPKPNQPPPPKEHLLPRKVITVVGPESSGTTFLASALGVAVGTFTEKGGWS